MKNLFFIAFFSSTVFAQNSMDTYRWYLNPQGQEVRVAIDDLNDEVLTATHEMDWGRAMIPGLSLKKEIVIAVIDGGIDIEHPELKDHIAYNTVECFEGTTIPPKDGEDRDNNGYKGDCAGWDFTDSSNRPEDYDGHGTHVTGIIATVLSGVQGDFKFLPLKVFAPDEGRQSAPGIAPLYQRLTKALEYAISRKVDVIHLSVGWPKSYMTVELDQMIKKAIEKGIMVVAAAGNSSQRATIYPCQMEGVICVGALRPNKDVARFSNWGMQVDIFAPGERILSTIPFTLNPTQISRKGYDYKNGTSQAAPFISAAVALLKGLNPSQSSDQIFARLMLTADAPVKGKGLKGLFHIDRALETTLTSFVYPLLKGLGSVVVDERNQFSVVLPVKNYGSLPSAALKLKLVCAEAKVSLRPSLAAVAPGLKADIRVEGILSKATNEINCDLSVGNETVSLRLKVLRKLNAIVKEVTAQQNDRFVINTRSGGRSRLLTLTTLKGQRPLPYYYVSGMKEPVVYFENEVLGTLKMSSGCSLLRLWQIDFNKDGETDIMLEGLCDDKHLSYRFFDKSLKEVYPEVKYRPTLTIVNYSDFELIPQRDGAPVFRFLNLGLNIPSTDPWAEPDTGKGVHLYELFPVKKPEGTKYDIRVIERPEVWQKSLGLRYLPQSGILHLMGDRLLVKIGQKTAWVDIKTQVATWANLDQFLIEGTRKQTVVGSSLDILQGFLTPYEYRGVMLDGTVLSSSQTNKFDPLIDIISTTKNKLGYLSILQSFQKLIYVQFGEKGEFLARTESTVDRFDFLTSQDLLASVVNLETETGSMQIVDGTKLNTNHVDVIKAGTLVSYLVPNECVTQQPVIVDGVASLPFFCAVSATEFRMQFLKL
jgi:hypothetical protein